MKKNIILVSSIVAASALGLGGVALGVNALTPKQATSSSAVAPSASSSSTPSATSVTTTKTTAEMLTYLIEEEKLAHDVYTVLAQKWGSNTFTNILSSETTHQSQVAVLLPVYGITDPRSSQIGVFTDPDLQKLYNDLVAQGSQSLTEAYKVGIAIEEMDIADLKADMALTSDPAILKVMQSLLDGSYNHLDAFQRKV